MSPDASEQYIDVPSIILPSIALPFCLENCSTVPVVGGYSTSIIVSDLTNFAAAPVVRTFLTLDRGVWDIAWQFGYQCSTADLALDVALQFQMVGPPTQSVSIASARGLVGQYTASERQIFSVPDNGISFILVMGGTAAGVGRVFASVSAQKLL